LSFGFHHFNIIRPGNIEHENKLCHTACCKLDPVFSQLPDAKGAMQERHVGRLRCWSPKIPDHFVPDTRVPPNYSNYPFVFRRLRAVTGAHIFAPPQARGPRHAFFFLFLGFDRRLRVGPCLASQQMFTCKERVGGRCRMWARRPETRAWKLGEVGKATTLQGLEYYLKGGWDMWLWASEFSTEDVLLNHRVRQRSADLQADGLRK
jgi:hypothetical protein